MTIRIRIRKRRYKSLISCVPNQHYPRCYSRNSSSVLPGTILVVLSLNYLRGALSLSQYPGGIIIELPAWCLPEHHPNPFAVYIFKWPARLVINNGMRYILYGCHGLNIPVIMTQVRGSSQY